MVLSSRRLALRVLCLGAVGLGSAVAVTSCKKDQTETCNPQERGFSKVRVVVQPTDQLNPDDEGAALSVVFRVYQLSGDTSLTSVDFETVWQKGGEAAFGNEFLAEQEIIVYPAKNEMLELTVDPAATHIVAVAIYREPVGQNWLRVWQVPKWHGHSVCAAERQGMPWPDPCFYVLLDRYRVEGGHTPPAGFDVSAATVECPGPPLTQPPPEPVQAKGKKKRKVDAKDLQDAQVPPTPSTPTTPSAPEAPATPGSPEAPTPPT